MYVKITCANIQTFFNFSEDEGQYVPEPLPLTPRRRQNYSNRHQSYVPFPSTRGRAVPRQNDIYASPSYRE